MVEVFKKSSLVVCVVLLTLAFSSCGSKKKITQKKIINSIEFISNSDKSLTEVIDLAKAQNKKVFVDFYAEWCLPCKLLDEEVFNHKEVYSYFNENFINYKVDIEKANGPNLKLMYGAQELPTLLFLDSSGSVVKRNDGNTGHTYIMSMAKEITAN